MTTIGVRSCTPADADLKASIRGHSVFFDRLVELIPSRFYLPVPDDKPWFQGLSKAAKASAKRQSRHNLKEARRARHDPDRPPPSTLQTLRTTLQTPADHSDSSQAQKGSLTYEELRQRLHRRIEELRAGRNTRSDSDRHPSKESKGKRKRTPDGPDEQGKQKKVNKPAVATADPAADLSFGQVKIEGEAGTKGNKKKKNKKPSKLQALERARKLKEAKENPEKGEAAAKRHSWQAAASRASGVKVHDDPKLLQESIKKEKRRRQRHAEKWKERVQSRDKAREEKQTARADNIKERIHQKKMRRIEKREKKLMRPGFEGRKKGYVNE